MDLSRVESNVSDVTLSDASQPAGVNRSDLGTPAGARTLEQAAAFYPPPPENYAMVLANILTEAFETPPPLPPDSVLTVTVNEKDLISIKTADRYLISFSAARQEIVIESPEKTKTLIWGDPHVVEGDGDTWDFKENSTFIFGKNKVSIETVDAGNGTTYAGTVHIYHDEQRVTVTDIDKNTPRLIAWRFDAKTADAALADGTRYERKVEGSRESLKSA